MNKEQPLPLRYFLGANSRSGFYSLYDGFVDTAGGDFLWVIKGGPGCGKSSFMKKIARAALDAGLPVETVHCSGDPDSLDGVYLPSFHTAYADGTAPHVLEAVYPGASSLVLDLGVFYDAGELARFRDDIIDLNTRYKALYQRAYDCLAAASLADGRRIPGLWGRPEMEKVRRKLSSLESREFRGPGSGGTDKRRFLSAITCKGRVCFPESASSLCPRIWLLDNELGLGYYYLDCLSAMASERGFSSLLCPDPLNPEKLEAVLVPELSLAVTVSEDLIPAGQEPEHRIRLDALAEKETLSAVRPALRKAKKLSAALCETGIESLAQAKALHDELESIYNPHVDFEGLYTAADKHISWLFKGVAHP